MADIQAQAEEEYENSKFIQLIDHFISKEELKLANLQLDAENYEANKESIKQTARLALEQIVEGSKKNRGRIIDNLAIRFDRYMWDYYVIEPLINDMDISDIKILAYNNITYKKNGDRFVSDFKFANQADYKRFVNMICTRNKKNMSTINAQVKFSDSLSNKNFRLRFNLSSEQINTSGIPSVHIRKIPKVKVTLDTLVKRKYMTTCQKNYLAECLKKGESVIFIGANASGKTTGVNALLEEFPKNKSALIIQETDELFLENHPHVNVQHTSDDNTESRVKHTLYELANVGLMDDDDMIVLGEVKSGDDAGALPAIIATGSQVMLTGHGNDELEGLYKLADYVKQATGYSLEQSLKFFSGIDIVCYIEKYRLKSISRVRGWDYRYNTLKMEKLDENCRIVSGFYENRKDAAGTINDSLEKIAQANHSLNEIAHAIRELTNSSGFMISLEDFEEA